jgi:DNA mismatch repair protein MutS2
MESRTYQLLELHKVLGHLARFAVSEAGRQACLAVRPALEPGEVERRAKLLSQAMTACRETGFRLGEFPALDGLLAALGNPRHCLDADDLCAVRAALSLVKTAREAFAGVGQAAAELTDLLRAAPWPEKTWSAVRRCLDPEGRIKDESSPDLLAVRSQVRSINQACTRKVKDFIQQEGLTGYLQDEFMTISSDRFVLPLKTNFKGRFKGIIHHYSQTGETCYFEPLFLVDLNNRLQELKREEREEEHKVLEYLTGLARDEGQALAGTYAFLVELDVLLAKVGLAAAFDGHPLFLSEAGGFALKNARHPLLALSGGAVQGQDILLGEGEKALIVSGGNAGGKTVCLKTLGLSALLALSGLPVPAEPESRLPFWHDIFVILGDEQSLEDAVSTFTAQIRAIARIWPAVDARALVILDEFGAGTDPAQGAALAQAVIDSLMERGARIAVATHFPALKAYGLSHEGVRSASVIFDPKTKRPLYKLAYDQVGASIALEVAREHGLPAEILTRAEQYLLLDGSDSSKLMSRLNELAVARESELSDLTRERVRLETRRKSLAEEFAARKRELLDQLKSQSQEIVREWRSGRVERKKALKVLAESRERLSAPEPGETPAPAPETLAVGATVLYRPWSKSGTVLEIDPRRGQTKLDIGGVSLWVPSDDLGPAAGPAPASAKAAAPATGGRGHLSLVLDLRGQRADEAVAELGRYLDQALLKGFERVEIIHGRGSGALRREVHSYLKNFPAAASFVLAGEDEGGDGKTIVDLAG